MQAFCHALFIIQCYSNNMAIFCFCQFLCLFFSISKITKQTMSRKRAMFVYICCCIISTVRFCLSIIFIRSCHFSFKHCKSAKSFLDFAHEVCGSKRKKHDVASIAKFPALAKSTLASTQVGLIVPPIILQNAKFFKVLHCAND